MLKLEDFPAAAYDKLRFGDTDAQGHINNAVIATFFETGRVSVLDALRTAGSRKTGFVVARITIDFRAEILFPGTVDIGTGVKTFGNSSITFSQAVFQNNKCVATAESVAVHIDSQTRRSTPLDESMRRHLTEMMMSGLEIKS